MNIVEVYRREEVTVIIGFVFMFDGEQPPGQNSTSIITKLYHKVCLRQE